MGARAAALVGRYVQGAAAAKASLAVVEAARTKSDLKSVLMAILGESPRTMQGGRRGGRAHRLPGGWTLARFGKTRAGLPPSSAPYRSSLGPAS